MTVKERLHAVVTAMSDAEAADVLRFLGERRRRGEMVGYLSGFPADDEPWASADETAIAEVESDRAAGLRRVSAAEARRDLGLS